MDVSSTRLRDSTSVNVPNRRPGSSFRWDVAVRLPASRALPRAAVHPRSPLNFHRKRLMRKPLVFLAAALLLAGCSSGTRVVYVPSPSPVQVPPPDVQTIVPPVGITIVRADQSRLLVSTNQPAYVAVFEIIPGQGVTLVYPTSARPRQVEHSGTSSLPVVWQSQRADASKGRYASNSSNRRNPNGYGHRPRARYVYAIASDRPLRLTDGAFDDESLRNALGARVYRAVDPYETIDALAQHFVPRQMDEDWGEDLLTIELARSGAPVRVAKVYCPGGSVVYVRDDLVDRAACPPRSRVRGTTTPSAAAPRPDSIVT